MIALAFTWLALITFGAFYWSRLMSLGKRSKVEELNRRLSDAYARQFEAKERGDSREYDAKAAMTALLKAEVGR